MNFTTLSHHAMSCTKVWKLSIDQEILKKDLQGKVGISAAHYYQAWEKRKYKCRDS